MCWLIDPHASSTTQPFFDPDSNLLYLAGKVSPKEIILYYIYCMYICTRMNGCYSPSARAEQSPAVCSCVAW